ncbi:MAG: MotA/TolQ/ExbB proton channel family protein [Myxococcales bacterium]|nr:MotA/TolQ/ExbB proton channel family protein [Myxococcales bacterium]
MLDFFARGGWVMVPLLACSLLAATVVVERTIFWIVEGWRRAPALVDSFLADCAKGNFEAAEATGRSSGDFVLKVLLSGLVHRSFSLSEAMSVASSEEVKRMRRFLGVLDTMITVAPLLGIFGTVTGIIGSFELLGAASIGDPKAVTAGIAEALITTAAGLSITIFSLLPYNYFLGRIEDAAHDMEVAATSLEVIWAKTCMEEAQRNEP